MGGRGWQSHGTIGIALILGNTAMGWANEAAENAPTDTRVQDEQVADLLKWARTQKVSWLATELDYDLSNLMKVLSGKTRPNRVICTSRYLI